MITPDELQAIRARAAAATPGPWRWRELGGETYLFADHGRRDVILSEALTRGPNGTMVLADAGLPNPDFIAAAREDVPRLVEEVERLQADRGCWKDAYEEERRLLQIEWQRADDLAAKLARVESATESAMRANWQMKDELIIKPLEAQLATLRAALEFYADPRNWYERTNDEGEREGWDCLDGPPGNSFPESGERARAALAAVDQVAGDLEAQLAALRAILTDFRDNFDCDTGANGSHPHYCRVCSAAAALADGAEPKGETP